jgi:hypothetical protein
MSIWECCGGIVRRGWDREPEVNNRLRKYVVPSTGQSWCVEINVGAVCAKQVTIYESVFFSQQNAGV